MAAPPSTCYCTVQTDGSYSVTYSTALLLFSTHRLSAGGLIAVVLVAAVAVLALAGVLLWMCRARLCQWRGWVEKSSPSNGSGTSATGQVDESDGPEEVSMAELTRAGRHDVRLMQQQVYSDYKE